MEPLPSCTLDLDRQLKEAYSQHIGSHMCFDKHKASGQLCYGKLLSCSVWVYTIPQQKFKRLGHMMKAFAYCSVTLLS